MLAMIPIGIYFYFYFKRILLFFHIDIEKKWIRIFLMMGSLIFVLPASYIFGFWAVVVLHLFVFSIMTDIIYGFIKNKIHYFLFHRIYQLGIIPCLCLFIVLGYGYWNIKDVQMKSYTIYSDKELCQNYRIAFISDLHFGNTMDKNTLETYCHKISMTHPNVVLLGGDIVDELSTKQEMKEAFKVLGNIDNKNGIYYVYGNHDRATYTNHPTFSFNELEEEITSQNIQILSDESIIIDDLNIIGREDRNHRTRKDSNELVSSFNKDYFLIMVDHQPVDLNVNDELKVDLQISGHTHGGQMFPVGLISDFLGFGEMNYGYQKLNYMQVIVSSGIAGWGYPLRTGSHSEYVIIDIKKNNNLER